MTGKQRLRDLWVKACTWDGINPGSKFVVFCENNPHAADYNKLAIELLTEDRHEQNRQR